MVVVVSTVAAVLGMVRSWSFGCGHRGGRLIAGTFLGRSAALRGVDGATPFTQPTRSAQQHQLTHSRTLISL